MQQQLRAPAYLRFVDDFIILGQSPAQLIERLGAIGEYLLTRRLRLHERTCVVRRTTEGELFLGYVVWPDRVRVRGETVRRF